MTLQNQNCTAIVLAHIYPLMLGLKPALPFEA
jgi:hypothetical protein